MALCRTILLAAALLLPALCPASADAGPATRGWRAFLVSGDAGSPAFDNAREAMRDPLRELGLSSSGTNSFTLDRKKVGDGVRLADLSNLEAAFRAASGDSTAGCFVFVTSHGNTNGIHLSARNETLTPAALDRMIESGCKGKPTIAILSGCHTGVFLGDSMPRPNRVILTASRDDRVSFGCGAQNTFTTFDLILLANLNHAAGRRIVSGADVDWMALHASVFNLVSADERRFDLVPSLPQAWFGRDWGYSQAESAGVQPADSLQAATAGKGLVFVELGAPWCHWCRLFEPEVARAAKARSDVRFRSIDVDKHPTTIGTVRGIPAYGLYRDGRLLASGSGKIDAEALSDWISRSVPMADSGAAGGGASLH